MTTDSDFKPLTMRRQYQSVEMGPDYELIHEVIHDPAYVAAIIDGNTYPVKVSKYNMCRYIDYNGIRFMEQNKNKKHADHITFTESAERARHGAKITWGMRPGKWIKIEN